MELKLEAVVNQPLNLGMIRPEHNYSIIGNYPTGWGNKDFVSYWPGNK